jgi:hypothetical protein
LDDIDHTKSTEINDLSSDNSSLGNESRDFASLLAKRELELAECKYHLKVITSMYEDITSSIIWKYTAPIRKLLDKINKNDFSTKGIAGSIKNLVLNPVHLAGRSNADWVGMINGCTRKIAIVPCLAEHDSLESRHAARLSEFLAGHGYLVLYASNALSEKERLKNAANDLNPSIFNVSLDDLLKHAGHLQLPQDCLHICFVTVPKRLLVESFSYFRQAGFSIVFEVLDDWEVSHANGKAVWFEREIEEQAVLSADLVAVVSMPLKNKFSHLRSDIACISGQDSADVDLLHSSDDRFEQLISEVTSKSIMRNIYA